MIRQITKFIDKLQLLDSDFPVVAGISGGKDSVVLLHILKQLGYSCIVAHCNFHLRDAASDGDEKFVQEMADNCGFIFEKIDFDTITYAHDKSISIEMAARELRYNWFETLRIKHRAQAIAVGHHADDNTETILLNLIRGTGIKGLAGIKPKNGFIVRPLLCVNRLEIEKYIHQHGIFYREDESNAENIYVRNQIRNQVIPLLENINPSFKLNLNEMGGILDEYYQWSNESLDLLFSKIYLFEDNQAKLNILQLKATGHSSLLLYHWLSPLGFHGDIIKQLNQSLLSEEPNTGKIFESEKFKLLIDRNYLILSNKIQSENEIYTLHYKNHPNLPFALSINSFEKGDHFIFSRNNEIVHLDADKISFPLTIRKWKKGDFFYPLGMNKRKKISDFLIDEKINLFNKEAIYVMLHNDQIVWVIGHRIDNRFKITPQTKNIVEFRL